MSSTEHIEEALATITQRQAELKEIRDAATRSPNDEAPRESLKRWRDLTVRVLSQTISSEEGEKLRRISPSVVFSLTPIGNVVRRDCDRYGAFLDALEHDIKAHPEVYFSTAAPSQSSEGVTTAPASMAGRSNSRRVFVVHGHDEALLQKVSRYLEKLKLRPVILLEQPSQGDTIIEKLERYGDVSFAVVLLTPDDVGRENNDGTELKARARQNVVFELGYFVGRLRRTKVAALYDPSVELPSDFLGVAYIAADPKDAWRLTLANELRASGIDIDLNLAISA